MIFCHLDRACDDINTIKKIVSKGVFAEFDTIGRFKYHSDEHEIEIIKELLADGYQHQILCFPRHNPGTSSRLSRGRHRIGLYFKNFHSADAEFRHRGKTNSRFLL